jgi:hypothetical protein
MPALFHKKYDYIIACGIRSLFVVGALSMMLRFRYIYNSLEIYSGKRFSSFLARMFKCVERYFNKHAAFTIVQDATRGELLRFINKLGFHDMVLFPNAPLEIRDSSLLVTAEEKGFVKKNRFGISPEKKVLLYAGSIAANWSGFQEIIKIIPLIPCEWITFMQFRMRSGEQLSMNVIRLIEEGRMIYSAEPLSLHDYDDLVVSSDVGLAWYAADEENIRYIGLSSGKIAHYFRHGKPLILNMVPFYKDIFAKYRCGRIIGSFSEIPAALNEVNQKYEEYSVGARQAYMDLFCLDKYMPKLLDKLRRHST